jgi:hypothetical protein
MALFSWLKGNDDISEIKRFIEISKELGEKQTECNILHQALRDVCMELYKHTGLMADLEPEYFINSVKKKYYGKGI